MGTASGNRLWGWVTAVTVLASIGLAGTAAYLTWGTSAVEAESRRDSFETENAALIRVHVVHPEKGKMPRMTRQPGTVLSFYSVGLFAEVSGYIQHQAVDIGAKVKRNQTLIQLDVPELNAQRDKAAAVVVQKDAIVKQAEARRKVAFADIKAADAKIVQADANANSAKYWLKYRKLQLDRITSLVLKDALEEKIQEESMERHEAARETLAATKAAIVTAKAEREAVGARVQQADADIEAAQADVTVAKAELKRAQAMVDFATIRAPFDGYITTRSKVPGDFVKAGTEAAGEPLLTVERTDKVRVVVQIPDRDVPYCDPGDKATVEIDALPGVQFPPAEITRIARAEETHTKLMRVEIDVDNKDGKLRQGMFGWVTIVLDRSPEQLSVPTSCLIGKARDGSATVYVVRDGIARLIPIKYGADNGRLVAVESGLTLRDQVIAEAPQGLHEDMPVEIEK